MEEENVKPKRKGIHKYFHVSKLDTYVYAIFSLGLFGLVGFKVANKVFELDMATTFITWVDTLQLAVLWGIMGIVSHNYYLKHEEKYDK